MKTLVVYDSQYGNTEKIAKAIGGGIGGDIKVIRPPEVTESDLASADLLIVGSPTQGGRPLKAIQDFLLALPTTSVKGKKVGAFDTRVPATWVKIFGFAAGRIGRAIKGKGGTLVLPPEGFYVTGTKGPLKDGELERAAGWGKRVASQ
jgi:flavodoxin I